MATEPERVLEDLARSIGLDTTQGVPALPVSNARAGKGRDLWLVDRILHSRVAKPVVASLRSSRLRPLLADVRRKHLLRPVEQRDELDPADELSSLVVGPELTDEALRYLRSQGLPSMTWRSVPDLVTVR